MGVIRPAGMDELCVYGGRTCGVVGSVGGKTTGHVGSRTCVIVAGVAGSIGVSGSVRVSRTCSVTKNIMFDNVIPTQQFEVLFNLIPEYHSNQ